MGRLDRYILWQVLGLFGFFGLVLVAVYWINRAVSLFDRLISDGQSAAVFFEFSLLTLPKVVMAVLPISAFAAVVYATNRMRGESELVVVQAAGVSGVRLARPIAVFGLICAGLMLVLTNALVPLAANRLDARSDEIARQVTAGLLIPGEFQHPVANVTLYIREVGEDGALSNLFLSDARREGRRTDYTATRARLVQADTGPVLLMYDGLAQRFEQEGKRLSVTRFEDFAFDITGLIGGSGLSRTDPDTLPTRDLLRADAATQSATGESRARLLFEGHQRFTQAAIAAVAPLLGFGAMMVGGYSRLGAWRQVGGAIVALIVLELLDNIAADATVGDARLWALVYVPPVLGLVAAGALFRLAAGPSRRRGAA